jgi:hypothetical protein
MTKRYKMPEKKFLREVGKLERRTRKADRKA